MTQKVKKMMVYDRAPDGSRHCQHCRVNLVSRPKGLCWSCYREKWIRLKYSVRIGPDGTTICQHCHANSIIKPRGLCRTCYYVYSIRIQYEPTANYVEPGADDVPLNPDYVRQPAAVPPGSEDKIDVMRERAENGVPLFDSRDTSQGGRRFYT